MTIRDIQESLGLLLCSPGESLDREVTGGYAGDLLSDVMAHSRPGQVWVTIQVHVNVVAVASLKEHAAIIMVNGRKPAPDTLERASGEKITILSSTLTAFELIGRLHEIGVGGAT